MKWRFSTALALYAALSVSMTWPLTAALGRDVPGDLGDSLLNMWILGWGAEKVPALLSGRIALADYWNANIFHPEPLALSFSEHLFGEVLQILPVYWITGNLILCYNLLFVSSFALSGLGMFLLVRDLLSGTPPPGHEHGERLGRSSVHLAAFVAGLVFAFIPFRIAQVAHIQSLQAQWMPLALYGFRRFVASGRAKPLVGGSAALLMQNWSNGYYLIFFAPFVPVFVLHQMWVFGRLRAWRVWLSFAAAALAVAAGTWPFLTLYLAAQRVHGFERSIGEVIRFSADVYSYLTAPEALRLWGGVMQAYPKPEGELFFGLVPWSLFVLGAIAVIPMDAFSESSPEARPKPRLRVVTWLLVAVIVVQAIGFAAILFTGGFITSLAGVPIRATNPTRILGGLAIAASLLFALSAPARTCARHALRSPAGLAVTFTLLAVWLSLGPLPQSRGESLPGLGLYGALYEHVPGFEGLRVPARFAMVAALFLSIVAGYGLAFVIRLAAVNGRAAASRTVALAIAALFLIEAAFVPLPVNLTWGDSGLPPPPRVFPSADAPPVYHTLANLPDSTVVAELPFGDPAWELRYVYYSTVHWKRLVNGYSGGFPQGYKVRVALLQRVAQNGDAAWRALRDAGTTHVVVHEAAFPAGEAAVVKQWLDDHFAVEIARFDGDLLYDVSGIWPPP
jgi:hypothetical protein